MDVPLKRLSLFTANTWNTINRLICNVWFHIYSSIFWISSLANQPRSDRNQDIDRVIKAYSGTQPSSLNRSISFDPNSFQEQGYFARPLNRRPRPPLPTFSQTLSDTHLPSPESPTRRTIKNHFQSLKQRQLSLNDVKRLFPRRQKSNTTQSVPSSPIPSHQIVYTAEPIDTCAVKTDCHRRRSVSDVLLKSIAWKPKDTKPFSQPEGWNASAPDLFQSSVALDSVPSGNWTSNKDKVPSSGPSLGLFRRRTTVGFASEK
ncbi:hypothetical protein CLU79DRAFT_772377 [Phycomyces nitens]|nr:hypothetical protein CLU79DRAFT_772377 [Phycomyces nitens]